jgi:hypothetical protein
MGPITTSRTFATTQLSLGLAVAFALLLKLSCRCVQVIVFGFTHIGVQVNGHMNVLYGVHTWNAAPLPPHFTMGVGIMLGGPDQPFNNHNDNRMIGCYMDCPPHTHSYQASAWLCAA